jgi:hypothetical protein
LDEGVGASNPEPRISDGGGVDGAQEHAEDRLEDHECAGWVE